jgi:phage shock protein C
MKRIYLSKTNSRIFGICGGIGQAYDIDPTLVRLVVVFLTLATAVIPGLVTYLLGWFIVPDQPLQQA